MTFQILSGAESLIKVKYTDICSSGHLNPLKTVFHKISGRLVFLKSLGKKKILEPSPYFSPAKHKVCVSLVMVT